MNTAGFYNKIDSAAQAVVMTTTLATRIKYGGSPEMTVKCEGNLFGYMVIKSHTLTSESAVRRNFEITKPCLIT